MTLIKIQSGKGQKHGACICVDNIDLQSGRCAVTHGDNNELVRSNSCSYCYASYTFKQNYSIKPAITEEQLKKEIFRREREKVRDRDSSKIVRTIRLGKMVDIWDPKNPEESKATLLGTMRSCNNMGKPMMLMTKLLPFDEDIVQELKVLNSALHYSLGNDALEVGAVKLGMPNSRRVEEAIKYKNANCNIYLRIVADVVQPMSKEFQELKKHKIPLLITPLRYSNKELFFQDTGLTWEEGKQSGKYRHVLGAMRPEEIHESWEEKTNAFCGHVGNKFGCNSCGLYGGKARWVKEEV